MALVARLALLGVLAWGLIHAEAPDVEILPLEGVREFPEATVPLAIQRACAADQVALEAYFAERGLRFEEKLVRKRRGYRACHLYFEPTLPGFRAAHDDQRITGLIGSVDSASFIGRRQPVGDSLDVLKAIAPQLGRPIGLELVVNQDFDPSHRAGALREHFGEMAEEIGVIDTALPIAHPWAQDFVKAGAADGRLVLLAPHRLFEGRGTDGEESRPLLDSLVDERFVRSKLSWEGGDIQFARDPRDSSRTILFHGGSAREYWGRDLTPEEFSYVLRVEFGADESVDLSSIGPHADYLVGFLPGSGTAVVAKPVRRDLALAADTLAELARFFGERTPPRATRLELSLRANPYPASEEAAAYLEELQHVRADLLALGPDVDPDLNRRLDAYIRQYCADDPDSCFDREGRRRMLDRDPELLSAALDGGARLEAAQSLSVKLLDLVEAQLLFEPDPNESKLNAKAREIERLGFRVIRAPALFPATFDVWVGASYVNALAFDRKLFVPALGLGASEDRLFEALQKEVGEDYEVVPAPARDAMLVNGGVHCVFGIVRAPAGT